MANPNPRRDRFLSDRRAGPVRGFYIHLTVYVLVMALLLVVNGLTPGPWWVQWPAIGWGIGLLGHAYLVRRSLWNTAAPGR